MDWLEASCPITDEPALINPETLGDVKEFDCPSCGQFKITNSALAMFKGLAPGERLERFEYAKVVAGANQVIVTTEHGSIEPDGSM